jgi:hypothetical protein
MAAVALRAPLARLLRPAVCMFSAVPRSRGQYAHVLADEGQEGTLKTWPRDWVISSPQDMADAWRDLNSS